MTPTAIAVSAIAFTGPSVSEAFRLDLAILAVLEAHETASVDSHQIAKAFFQDRKRGDLRQCTDYIQHLFREAQHVCRYADADGFYHLHRAVECSSQCAEHATRAQTHRMRPVSQCCFLEVTTMGFCPMGCDE